MADYLVTLDRAINFNPETEVEEILQNVRTILATRIGTVPLHRDFGISWEMLDRPLPVAKMLLQVAVIDAISEFEPRAEVKSVEFEGDAVDAMEGRLTPKVIISIAGEDDEEEEI